MFFSEGVPHVLAGIIITGHLSILIVQIFFKFGKGGYLLGVTVFHSLEKNCLHSLSWNRVNGKQEGSKERNIARYFKGSTKVALR